MIVCKHLYIHWHKVTNCVIDMCCLLFRPCLTCVMGLSPISTGRRHTASLISRAREYILWLSGIEHWLSHRCPRFDSRWWQSEFWMTIRLSCYIWYPTEKPTVVTVFDLISTPYKISAEIIGIRVPFIQEHGLWAGYLMFKTVIFHFLVKV